MAAAIFWLKVCPGWREKHDVNVTTQPCTEPNDAQLEDILRKDQHRWIEGQASEE